MASLPPTAKGERPQIGTCLVFVYGGRRRRIRVSSHGTYRDDVDGMENVKDGKGFREAVSASRKNEQGAFVDPRTGRAFPVSRVVNHDV